MELYKVRQRLIQIQKEFHGYNSFTKNTMARVEKLAKEIKPLAVKIFGEDDEITGELESAILISKDNNQKSPVVEREVITEALRHLQYGVALFLD